MLLASRKRTPLRILYVLNYSLPGGPATSLVDVLNRLDSQTIVPFVYAPGVSVARIFSKRGIPVFVGPVSRLTHFAYFTYRGRDWLFFIYELLLLPFHAIGFIIALAWSRCDIVHLNEGNLIATAILAKVFGRKVVWHIRSVLPACCSSVLSRMIKRAYSYLADAIVAIDNTVSEPIKDLSTLRVIRNPVDVDLFSSAKSGRTRASYMISPETICVAMVGRADPAEGLFEYVGAAEYLARHGRGDVKFLWIGAEGRSTDGGARVLYKVAKVLGLTTGSQTAMVQKAIRMKKVQDQFVFVPFQADMASVYKEIDIVVTGGVAGLGRQAAEAAAAGRPVIGLSNINESDLIVDGVTGYIVPVGRADLLGERILKLADNRTMREAMGKSAFERAQELTNPEKVARLFLEVYKSVLVGETGLQ